MGDQEEQEDELLALESIYDAAILSIINEKDDKGGQFKASPRLPDPFYIQSEPVTKESTEPKLHKIQHLTPVVLNFQLPVKYPSESSPQFTLTCKWLTKKQLCQVCKHLDELWEENVGSVILFTWINFLHEDLFEFLQLTSPLDIWNVVTSLQGRNKKQMHDNCWIENSFDPCCIQDIESRHWLLVTILDFDKQMKSDIFDKSMFLCNVCFMEKQGTLCFIFKGCEHVFCSECMCDYFVVQINDGNVLGLICPHSECDSEALPSQVKNLVPEEKFSRYDELLLKSGLDMMMDIMYCPRRRCAYPVSMEKDSAFGNCPSCYFVFCRLCKLVYHGVSPCRLKSDDLKMLREEYEYADYEGRKFLETKYGKKNIEQAMEECRTREWLESNTKACSACGFHIQKIDGCNKMMCIKCRNYFCWLCGETLSRSNPYMHFNIDGPCRNRLFEGINQQEFDFEDDEGLGLLMF